MSIFRNGEARQFTAGQASGRIYKTGNNGWYFDGHEWSDEDLVEIIGQLLERADYDDPEGAALAVQRYFNEADF